MYIMYLYDMYIYIMCSHMYIFCYISLKKPPTNIKTQGFSIICKLFANVTAMEVLHFYFI